ncbi:MAG: WG repeat-containing protein [Roseburia sp.]|nr:WG repeat-containing protein [Roseburia sp.]
MKRKSWKCIVGIAVMVFALLLMGALILRKDLQINPPLADQYELRGVDVSHYQGTIDWETLALQDLDFAFIKATEGSGHIDERFYENWEAAAETPLYIGAYHFFSFDSAGETQAELYIRTVGDLNGKLPPVIDVEYYGDKRSNAPDKAEVTKNLKALLDALEEHYEVKPILYTTRAAWQDYIKGSFGEYPLWVRSVYCPPEVLFGGGWSFWQYTDTAVLEGYSGDERYIDMNVFRGTREDLEELLVVPGTQYSLPALEELLVRPRMYPLLTSITDFDGFINLVFASEGRYCIYNGEKYGVYAEDGEKIASCSYDMLYPFHEGLACAFDGEKFGYIDYMGTAVIPFVYDRAAPFMEGLAYFAKGDAYGFMDKTGEPVFYLDCDSVSSFQEGLAYFSTDGQYGYIDRTGQTVIEPKYDDADYFREGLAVVMKNGRYGVITREGTELIALEYDSVEFDGAFIIGRSGGEAHCFDRSGKRLFQRTCDRICEDEGYIVFREEGQYGIAGPDGAVLIEPGYAYLDLLEGGTLAEAEQEGAYGVIDLHGTVQAPFEYSRIESPDTDEAGILAVWDMDGRMGCLDTADFSMRIPCVYDSIQWSGDGRAVVSRDGRYGVLSRDGSLTIPIEYALIQIFADGSIFLQKASEARIVNCEGEETEAALYDSICAAGSCYRTTRNGRTGFLNGRGEEIIPPIYECTTYEVVGSDDSEGPVFIAERYGLDDKYVLITTDDTASVDLSGIWLKNEITPRRKEYSEFVQRNGDADAEGARGDRAVNGLKCFNCSYRLYDIAHSGQPLLYFYAAPYYYYDRETFSGFFALRDGRVEALLTGYECGGTSGGDTMGIWYDTEEKKLLTGKQESCGGFGGYSYGWSLYEYKEEETAFVCSIEYREQYANNHTQEELFTTPDLFYGAEGKKDRPYTEETIAQAEWVIEYSVNGERTDMETYTAAAERYRLIFCRRF